MYVQKPSHLMFDNLIHFIDDVWNLYQSHNQIDRMNECCCMISETLNQFSEHSLFMKRLRELMKNKNIDVMFWNKNERINERWFERTWWLLFCIYVNYQWIEWCVEWVKQRQFTHFTQIYPDLHVPFLWELFCLLLQ